MVSMVTVFLLSISYSYFNAHMVIYRIINSFFLFVSLFLFSVEMFELGTLVAAISVNKTGLSK